MDLGLSGRACIVTGASRGIGLAIARRLSVEGARVLLVARDRARLEEAAEECRSAGEPAGAAVEHEAADVVHAGVPQWIVARAESRFGRLDVLVNNAGTSRNRPIEELTDEDWQHQWELHVMSSMRMMRAAAPAMAARGHGRIVNVSSSSGKRPSLTNAAYSVSKAAQLALSRAYADAYAAQGVLVNAVTPGPVDTPLWHAPGGLADQAARAKGISRDEALEAARAKIPLGRFGTDEEIAAVVVFLCSAGAGYVAGAAWSVDGGAVPTIV
jgi:3-oxoacyl-[acyl-carrier protein] reductase